MKTRMTDSQIILYQSPDGRTRIELKAQDDMAWLTQAQIAELFQKKTPTINEHIKNIYEEGELLPESTIRKFRIVQKEGNRDVERNVDHYNLDMILAVGYRVRSTRGTQFRLWATTTLKEYLIKGFAMDDKRLKDPQAFDYFDELLERIKDIRASEKRFYQNVKDIYATSIDYDPQSLAAQDFFKKVQNKMLWAVTGHTAAEIKEARSNPKLANMGLTSWKGSRVRKGDVTTAKNYLKEDEMKELNRIVTMYLDYAEDQAKRRKAMTMDDWSEKLDAFISFNERELLTHAGKISADIADKLALERYDEFDTARKAQEAIEADMEDIKELEAIEKQSQKKIKKKKE